MWFVQLAQWLVDPTHHRESWTWLIQLARWQVRRWWFCCFDARESSVREIEWSFLRSLSCNTLRSFSFPYFYSRGFCDIDFVITDFDRNIGHGIKEFIPKHEKIGKTFSWKVFAINDESYKMIFRQTNFRSFLGKTSSIRCSLLYNNFRKTFTENLS